MANLLSKTFSDAGTSSALFFKKGDVFTYTVDLSNDFDGVLYMRFTSNNQQYELTRVSADATSVYVEVTQDGLYDFKCQYGAGLGALTGTAACSIAYVDKLLFEVKDLAGAPKLQVSKSGLKLYGDHTADGVGAPNGSGVTVVEKGNAVIHQTVVSLSSLSVTVANTTGASFGNSKLYDFPEGRILVLGVTASLSFNWAGTDIAATGSGDFSLGTTGTSDATLNGTDVDLLPSSAMTDPFVAGVGTGTGALAASAHFDGTATAKDMYLNIIIDDADVADAASDDVLVTGTVTVTWINLGDY